LPSFTLILAPIDENPGVYWSVETCRAVAIGLAACLNASLLYWQLRKEAKIFTHQPGWIMAFLLRLVVAVLVMSGWRVLFGYVTYHCQVVIMGTMPGVLLRLMAVVLAGLPRTSLHFVAGTGLKLKVPAGRCNNARTARCRPGISQIENLFLPPPRWVVEVLTVSPHMASVLILISNISSAC